MGDWFGIGRPKMDVNTIIFLILGGLAGGFINGFSGTGTALFALVFFFAGA